MLETKRLNDMTEMKQSFLNVVGFFDNVMLQLALACQGIGVASLPFVIGEAEPDLVRISEPVAKTEVWLLYHTDLRNTSRVRAVRDFLQESVRGQLKALDSSLQKTAAINLN